MPFPGRLIMCPYSQMLLKASNQIRAYQMHPIFVCNMHQAISEWANMEILKVQHQKQPKGGKLSWNTMTFVVSRNFNNIIRGFIMLKNVLKKLQYGLKRNLKWIPSSLYNQKLTRGTHQHSVHLIRPKDSKISDLTMGEKFW